MSSDFADIRKVIVDRLNSGWSSTPVAWPGVKHIPPASENYFAQANVHFSDHHQAELNGSREIQGFLAVTLFGREDLGTVALMQYQDALNDLFPIGLSLVTAGSGRPVRFRAMQPKPSVDPNEGWVAAPVICPFYFFTT